MFDEFASGEDTAYYTYDAAWRKVQAKRNGTVEKYIHDFFNAVADYDGSDTLVATYNTPMLDWNLTKKIGANVYFYLKDGQRSIRNLLDSDETAQNTYDYKAFGSVYGSPTENITNRYRYTSREWESVLDLYFSRARMYDPSIGRFLGRDPLGGGSCGNNYSYACNRPLLFSDPLGLYTVLFKGYDKAKKKVHSYAITSAKDLLNKLGEPAHEYTHHNKDIEKAFKELQDYVNSYKEANCHYPEVNVVGYSCGTDSALALVHKIEDRNKLRGFGPIVRNLVYLDFNWGTVHADYCRHGTDNHYNPEIAGNVWHFISTGTMEYGCQKNPKHEFYTPYCNIIRHTQKLWEHWPDPDDGKNWWEMFWIIAKIGAGEDAVLNTTGIWTGSRIWQLGWPILIEQWMLCGDNMDHYKLGDNVGVGDQVASIILRPTVYLPVWPVCKPYGR